MDELREQMQSGNVHHAYLIEGSPDSAFQEVLELLETELGVHTQGNPDVYITHGETLSIDEARALKRFASLAPSIGDKKFIIVSFYFITTEAQNALLKVLEEPTQSTHFFLITPSAHTLLETVRSRLHIIQGSGGTIDETFVKKFLHAPHGERMTLVRGIIEAKDRAKAVSFLNELEQILRSKNNLLATGDRVSVFDEVRQARDHIESRSSSIKMVLEHISLVIPKGGILQTI